MRNLTDDELETIYDILYNTAQDNILKKYNKKDFEDWEITINLEQIDGQLDVQMSIDLVGDCIIDDEFTQFVIDKSFEKLDEYIKRLE